MENCLEQGERKVPAIEAEERGRRRSTDSGEKADATCKVRRFERDGASGVPLVFMTHETTARAMSGALKRAADAGLLREPAVYYRVL